MRDGNAATSIGYQKCSNTIKRFVLSAHSWVVLCDGVIDIPWYVTCLTNGLYRWGCHDSRVLKSFGHCPLRPLAGAHHSQRSLVWGNCESCIWLGWFPLGTPVSSFIDNWLVTIKPCWKGNENQTYVWFYTHTYTHIHVYAYIHTYIHTYIDAYIHTYINTYMHARTNAHTHTHTHIHTYIHTYKHIYVCHMPTTILRWKSLINGDFGHLYHFVSRTWRHRSPFCYLPQQLPVIGRVRPPNLTISHNLSARNCSFSCFSRNRTLKMQTHSTLFYLHLIVVAFVS